MAANNSNNNIGTGAYGFVGAGNNNQHEQIAELIKEESANGKNPQEVIERVLDRLGIKDEIIVFYGFQGLLANTFSTIKSTDQEETRLMCFALDDTVSPVFMNMLDFYQFFNKYNVPEGTLNPVKFDDAMATLRLGEKMNRKEAKFEDSEVDEFDDDCNEDCIPGNHTCGK